MFFEYPHLLWLLLLVAVVIAIYIFRELKGLKPYLIVSSITPWQYKGGYVKRVLRHIPFVLRVIALTAIVFAIARPRSATDFERVDTEGIDIVLAMDVSTSMLARDFKPDRIGAAKDIAIRFISERPSDRIGIVVFAGEAYTKCPSTIDHDILQKLLSSTTSGEIDDGTAIGDGLATAINRIKDSKSKSKVIILVTDGVNNMGAIDPLTAASIAKEYGIRVYTIGVGKMGYAPYPYQTPFGKQYQNVEVKIDESLLQ